MPRRLSQQVNAWQHSRGSARVHEFSGCLFVAFSGAEGDYNVRHTLPCWLLSVFRRRGRSGGFLAPGWAVMQRDGEAEPKGHVGHTDNENDSQHCFALVGLRAGRAGTNTSQA